MNDLLRRLGAEFLAENPQPIYASDGSYFPSDFFEANLFEALGTVGLSRVPIGILTGTEMAGPFYFHAEVEGFATLGRAALFENGEISIELLPEEPNVSGKPFVEVAAFKNIQEIHGQTTDFEEVKIVKFQPTLISNTGEVSIQSGRADRYEQMAPGGKPDYVIAHIDPFRFFGEEITQYKSNTVIESIRDTTTVEFDGWKVTFRERKGSDRVMVRIDSFEKWNENRLDLLIALSIASFSFVRNLKVDYFSIFGEQIGFALDGRSRALRRSGFPPLIEDSYVGPGSLSSFLRLYFSLSKDQRRWSEDIIGTIEVSRAESLEAQGALLGVILRRMLKRDAKQFELTHFTYSDAIGILAREFKISPPSGEIGHTLQAIENLATDIGNSEKWNAILAGIDFIHHCYFHRIGWNGNFCSLLKRGEPVAPRAV